MKELNHRLSIVLLLFASLLLNCCTTRKATAAEEILWGEGVTEKYWVFNHVITNAVRGEQHYCVLVTQSPSAEGNAMSIFLSHWDSYDSSYHQGMVTAPQATWSKPNKWPWIAQPAAQNGDSASPDWRIFWNHRSFWLNGQFSSTPHSSMALKMRFSDHEPFEPHQTYPPILADSTESNPLYVGPTVHALTARVGQSQRNSEKPVSSYSQGAVFDKMNVLLQARGTKAIYWIQTRFPDGWENGKLLSLSTGDQITVLSHYWYHADMQDWGEVDHENEIWETLDAWSSPHSHKTYYLGIHVKSSVYEYNIRPKANVQEFQAGNRSFWMGAAEIANASDGSTFATGNMYIFTR